MAGTYTSYKNIYLPEVSADTGAWGGYLNTNSFPVIDKNLGGIQSVALSSSDVDLDVDVGATASQNVILKFTGTLSDDIVVTTSCEGFHIVENLCTLGSYTVTITNGISGVVVPYGRSFVVFDGTNGARIVATSQIAALSGAGVIKRSSAGALSLDSGTTNLIFSRDNGGIELSSGIHGDIPVPFACTITGVTLLADQSGDMVIDFWKNAYASYPPTVANTITASAKPTLASAYKYVDTTLTGWTTSVSAGDILRVNVDSVSTITRYTLGLTVTRY